MTLLLASASPRRAELLRAAGFHFVVQPTNADESLRDAETPDEYVRRVAEAKARAAVAAAENHLILAADTTVVIDGRILGKPVDDADAVRMLRLLSGRRHEVLTAVTLLRSSRVITQVEITAVDFVPLSEEEIAWYVASGEAADKAGAYGVQGLASRFVTGIIGSYTNVVGLPIALVYRMLRDFEA